VGVVAVVADVATVSDNRMQPMKGDSTCQEEMEQARRDKGPKQDVGSAPAPRDKRRKQARAGARHTVKAVGLDKDEAWDKAAVGEPDEAAIANPIASVPFPIRPKLS
jgi:hypothetical protein